MEELKKGIIYDLPHGVTYDLTRGITYDEEPAKNTKEIQRTSCTGIMMTPQVVVADCLNFTLKLLRRIIDVFDTEAGEEENYFYDMQVAVISLNGKSLIFEGMVAGDKVKGTDWLKRVTHSIATIPGNKEEKEEFLRKVQIALEDEKALTEIRYPNAGWRKIPNLGWRYVYENGYIGGTTDLVHAPQKRYALDLNPAWLGKKENFYKAMEMCDICRNGRASTALVLFVHTTLLNELFEQAGEPLNFTFGVLGVTNSRKTSLVTAIAKIFDRSRLIADAEFATATDCGIEKTLSLYKDAPVLIDDFKPGANRAQQSVLNAKLDNLLRLYGNRVTKKRMTDFMADGDKKYFPIGGGCVITLEVLDAVLSSVSRLFVTEIGAEEVVNERLRFFQENRWILPNHVFDFIAWITPNFEKVVEFIQSNFKQDRCKHKFAFPRYSEMFATLVTTAKIIGFYASAKGFWSESESSLWVSKCEDCIASELQIMGRKWRGCDKGMLAITAFLEALRTGKMERHILNEQNCSARLMLYEDETRFFVRSKFLRAIVNDYCKLFGESQQLVNDNELIGLLERKKILEILVKNGTQESSRKLPIQKGNTLRYLYILKSELLKYDEL